MGITPVRTQDAPTPPRHYSQAAVYNGPVFVSGQPAVGPRTGGRRLGPVEGQTGQALENAGGILKAAGSDPSRALTMTAYISDIGLWGRVNGTYARVLGGRRPARAVIPTKGLHRGLLIEIDAVAATYS